MKNSYSNIFKDTINKIEDNNDMLYSFSNEFKFNFKQKISKIQKYKTIAVIGMGGSVLGSEAIYSFLKKDKKKMFIFLTILIKQKLEI